jgi:hypothetical protein
MTVKKIVHFSEPWKENVDEAKIGTKYFTLPLKLGTF